MQHPIYQDALMEQNTGNAPETGQNTATLEQFMKNAKHADAQATAFAANPGNVSLQFRI